MNSQFKPILIFGLGIMVSLSACTNSNMACAL